MGNSRIFDFRTYTAAPGRLEALTSRFRDHTLSLFERHNIKVVGFFEPLDRDDTLLYITEFESDEAADLAWESFGNDPDWARIKASTETEGPLALHVVSERFRASDLPLSS